MCELSLEKRGNYYCVTAVSVGSATRGENCGTATASARREAVLWLLLQPGENKRVESPSSLLAHALSTMDSVNGANSMNSKTIGLTNRISNKLVLTLKLALNQEVS